MPTSDPYKTPYEDPAAKKKREDPLADYFGGQAKAPAPAPAPEMQAQVAPVQMASPNMAQPSNTAQPAAQRRPGPTGFTNFNRVIAANKDVSNREAAAYGQRAQQNAQQARTSLDALRKRFGEGVAAGTLGGPEMGFAQQPADGAGLVGESTRATMGGGLSSDQMLANAQAGYTGPAGLAEMKGAGDVYGSALGAEQNLNALGTEEGLQSLIQQQNMAGNKGTSQLSSALIGNAGRGDFNALRERFNPQAEADTAEKEAQDQAKAAGETSKASAENWRVLGEKTKSTEDALRLAQGARSSPADVAAAKKAREEGLKTLPPYRGEKITWESMKSGKTQGQGWAPTADWGPKSAQRMIDDLAGGHASAGTYNGLTGMSSSPTGLTKDQIESVLASMSEEEFNRFYQASDYQKKANYIRMKYDTSAADQGGDSYRNQ